MKRRFTIIAVLFSILTINAQDPNILWQRTIGGGDTEEIWAMQETGDGGVVLGGQSFSNISGEKTENSNGQSDFWVVKLNASGDIEWQNTIGGNDEEYLYVLESTLDGGYILGGISKSDISGDKTENSMGQEDYWIVKINASGEIQWQNTIGGQRTDILTSIVVISDGTYLLSGHSNSDISPDKSENAIGATYDFWVVKIDALGTIIWDNTIGGTGNDNAGAAVQTSDGGFVIAGSSHSNTSGDKTEDSQGLSDYWVVKLDAAGNIEWQNTIGGSASDVCYKIIQDTDGGYILAGDSNSNISGDKTENDQGNGDYWILKLDGGGNILWQNTIGGNDRDSCFTVIQLNEGKYMVGGFSESNIGGDKTENSNGSADYWIVELDNAGDISDQNTIGGNFFDILTTLAINSSGELLLGGGSSSSISGDKTEASRGAGDFWVLKYFISLGLEENLLDNAITLYPNPVKNSLFLNSQNQTIDNVIIYNVTGNQILQLEVHTISPVLVVSSLTSGLYFLQLHSGEKVALKKFVKE